MALAVFPGRQVAQALIRADAGVETVVEFFECRTSSAVDRSCLRWHNAYRKGDEARRNCYVVVDVADSLYGRGAVEAMCFPGRLATDNRLNPRVMGLASPPQRGRLLLEWTRAGAVVWPRRMQLNI